MVGISILLLNPLLKQTFVKQEAIQLLKDGIDLIPDSDKALSNLLSYPLLDTLTRCLVNFLCLSDGFMIVCLHST